MKLKCPYCSKSGFCECCINLEIEVDKPEVKKEDKESIDTSTITLGLESLKNLLDNYKGIL